MSNEKILEALKKATQAEIEGQHFYAMAAMATQDPMGRQVFETLAREEQAHARFLRAQHDSILETGHADSSLSLGSPLELLGSSPIFSDLLKSRVKGAHYEMTALSIGIQLEADAQHFYRVQAELAHDSVVRDFFLELANWESGHYHALLAQQESLKEEYWADNGFAPY